MWRQEIASNRADRAILSHWDAWFGLPTPGNGVDCKQERQRAASAELLTRNDSTLHPEDQLYTRNPSKAWEHIAVSEKSVGFDPGAPVVNNKKKTSMENLPSETVTKVNVRVFRSNSRTRIFHTEQVAGHRGGFSR